MENLKWKIFFMSPEGDFFMFTGIISHLGKLTNKSGSVYDISLPKELMQQITAGTSIAVNGICLTVFNKLPNNTVQIEIMPETVKRSAFMDLKTGDLINLELPATPNTMLSGHIVQGHIDGTGTIQKIIADENSRIITITVPSQLQKYIVEKGSIAVNGISLTVISCNKNSFTVGIIPFTWKHTMLQQIKVGDRVNIETDIVGKYILSSLE